MPMQAVAAAITANVMAFQKNFLIMQLSLSAGISEIVLGFVRPPDSLRG
jgi:hypothetical protein